MARALNFQEVPLVRGLEKLTLGDTVDIAWMLLNAAVMVVPVALGATLLYWIIRLGVKHGLRSYYAQSNQKPDAVSPAHQPESLG